MRTPNRLQMYGRFVRYLLWEFRWPLGVFAGLVLLGGWGLHEFYHRREITYPQACYAVFLLIFLQSNLEFPDEWYLQPFFFLLPIVGLGALADSVVRLGYLVFARKQNLPEWQRMVASMYRNHIVVVGVGKVGYRIIKGLLALKEPVVGVERKPDSLLVEEIQDLGVPIIVGNARNQKTLEQAGVDRARAIILATDDDLTNLDAALTARDLNPSIQAVLRLFDDNLASKFAGAFNMPALSAGQVSAPAFIAAATGRKVYHDFQLDGEHLHLTDVTINPSASLVGRTVGDMQKQHGVNIVMHRGPKGVNVNPPHDIVLSAGDTLLVIAPMERLVELEAANGVKPTKAKG